MKVCPNIHCESESNKEWCDEVKYCLVVNSNTKKICGTPLVPKK